MALKNPMEVAANAAPKGGANLLAPPAQPKPASTAPAAGIADGMKNAMSEYVSNWSGPAAAAGAGAGAGSAATSDPGAAPFTGTHKPLQINPQPGAMPGAMQGSSLDRAQNYVQAWNELGAGGDLPAGSKPGIGDVLERSATGLPSAQDAAGAAPSVAEQAAAANSSSDAAATADKPEPRFKPWVKPTTLADIDPKDRVEIREMARKAGALRIPSGAPHWEATDDQMEIDAEWLDNLFNPKGEGAEEAKPEDAAVAPPVEQPAVSPRQEVEQYVTSWNADGPTREVAQVDRSALDGGNETKNIRDALVDTARRVQKPPMHAAAVRGNTGFA